MNGAFARRKAAQDALEHWTQVSGKMMQLKFDTIGNRNHISVFSIQVQFPQGNQMITTWSDTYEYAIWPEAGAPPQVGALISVYLEPVPAPRHCIAPQWVVATAERKIQRLFRIGGFFALLFAVGYGFHFYNSRPRRAAS